MKRSHFPRRGALWLPALGLLVLAALAATFLLTDTSNAAPVLTTDKADYFSAEIAHIAGSGFAANTQYDIPVIRPDGSIVKGDGSFTLGWDSVTANLSGSFTYDYQLDGIFGTYEIRVYPKPWSGNVSEAPLVSKTFTDADIDFTQCKNDSDNNDSADPCAWTTGGLNQNNSIFAEGQAVPQRLFHKLTAVGAYEMEFEVDFTKASIYSYDFMTNATDLPQGSGNLNQCGDLPGFISAAACSTIFSGASPASIDPDRFDSVSTAEATAGSRSVTVGCSGPGSCSGFDFVFPNLDGAGENGFSDPEAHSPDSDPDCYQNCGTSAVKFRVRVTTPAGTSSSTPTIVGVWFGGHLASSSVWGASPACGGNACGASSISGAPFHLKYMCLQEPGSTSCDAVGNRDNQISPGTVQPGSITIAKETNPNGDTQSFSFTCTSPLGSFSLSDGGSQPFPGLPAGSYTCTETVPSGWASPPSISCSGDMDGGTPASSSSTSIVIDLDGGENITCTFNNTKQGTITIVKDAVPNDPQDFSFTCPAPIGSFTLDDDGANGNPLNNSKTTAGLAAGTYTCTETVPSGWDSPPSITCGGDTDGGTPASSSSTSVAIDLDPGENITCTFINNQQVGTITIVKNAVPDDPQDFSFTCSAPIGSFTLDDDGANGNPLNNYKTTTGLSAGTYSCSETAVSGWPQTSATCDDGSPPSAISLQAGESVTCTFTNNGAGNIIVCKQTDPDGDVQSFNLTTSYPPSGFSLSDGQCNNSGNLAPGTYSVSEAVPALWTLTGATCTDGSPPSAISLQAGETVTCTFNNQKYGKIIIIKDAQPNDPNQDFSFDCQPVIGPFILDDDSDPMFSTTAMFDVPPGTYNCGETVPSGWTLTSAICSDGSPPGAISLQAGETVTCTFVDILNSATFTVYKDFTDKPGTDTTTVSVTLTCGAGTIVAPNPKPASEAAPAVFTVTGLASSTTCTASEGTAPAGYAASGCTTPVTLPATGTASCTITNTLIPGTITVCKETVPNGSSQSFTFTPSYGTSFPLTDGQCNTSTPLAPGTYSVAETVPGGWTVTPEPPNRCNDGSPSGSIALGPGEAVVCTFNNTLNSAAFTVYKDFTDKPGTDTTTVSVTLTCGAGTIVAPNPKPASEAAPAVFTVTGLASSTTCTASEGTAPAGYAASGCTTPVTLPATGTASCTITNTLLPKTFIVNKDFSDNNTADVNVTLTCSVGVVTPDDPTASETDPANFTVANFIAGTTCTATETGLPATYTWTNPAACLNVPLATGSCTLINTRNDASFQVRKDFTDDNPQDVPVALSCTSGTVVAVDANASESDPADFTIQGIVAGTTCNATETAPFPYYQQSSNCTGVPVSIGGTGSCTIVNAIIPPGENPVGGIVGLIDGSATESSAAASGGREATPLMAVLVGGLLAATATAAWFARRRMI